MLKNREEISDYWNSFSQLYGTELEHIYLQSGLNLSRMLKVEEKKNILEVGCGSGYLTAHLLTRLSKGCNYTSIDFATDMIKLAEKRKESIDGKIGDVSHKFVCGDGEDLTFVPEESIDAYVASLVLHLTPNPHQLLKEAKRVLKKGECLGLTVLGKVENCSFFNIAHSALKKNGVNLPDRSSGGITLNEKDLLIKISQECGLEVVFCWQEKLTFDVFEEKELIKVLGQPRIAKILSELEKDIKKKVLLDAKLALEEMKERFEPLQVDLLYLIAKKPE